MEESSSKDDLVDIFELNTVISNEQDTFETLLNLVVKSGELTAIHLSSLVSSQFFSGRIFSDKSRLLLRFVVVLCICCLLSGLDTYQIHCITSYNLHTIRYLLIHTHIV